MTCCWLQYKKKKCELIKKVKIKEKRERTDESERGTREENLH